MGYILPINHYQYEQYHDRDIQKGYDPFKIGAAYRINRIKQSQFMYEESSPNHREEKKDILRKKEPPKNVEKIRGQITGKGNNFNAIV